MKTMREGFESLTQIKNILEYNESDNIVFDEEKQEYKAELYTTFVPEYIEWINGAWYAYKEQQKRIDAMVKYINELSDSDCLIQQCISDDLMQILKDGEYKE